MNIGMNQKTGRALSDYDHLSQSITKILTTPIASRIKRRTVGSLVPDLIDDPTNEHSVILLYAATATALMLHEPRFRLTRVQLVVNADNPGESTLELDGVASLGGLKSATSISASVFNGGA